MVPRYSVTVYDALEGDVVEYEREADDERLSEMREWYDDGMHSVVVDREWDEDDE